MVVRIHSSSRIFSIETLYFYQIFCRSLQVFQLENVLCSGECSVGAGEVEQRELVWGYSSVLWRTGQSGHDLWPGPTGSGGSLMFGTLFFLFSGLWSSSWTHKHETSSVQQGIISNSVIDDFQKDFVVDVSPEIKALVQREKHRSLLDLTFEFLCD